uniref:Uncharacterized protein n=1 Tax=Cannabis sativa TaxID=3483 RepID=A0A803QXB8_CANSA
MQGLFPHGWVATPPIPTALMFLPGTISRPHQLPYVLLDPQLDLQILDIVGSLIKSLFLQIIHNRMRMRKLR